MKSGGIGKVFMTTGLVALTAGVIMGNAAAFQFLFPGLLDVLPFFKSRPLHVSLVVSWIFLCATGGIYYYLPRYCRLPLFSDKMAAIHFWIFILTGLAILTSYIVGHFGGREYWEYPPVLSIPIILSWILFGFNYFKTAMKMKEKWPVYLWMWGTGIVFFLFTFLEAHAWLLPWFSDNVVREITVQWKSYGALVGSWNMLVNGTALFLMERISGNDRVASSKMAFFLYFLGFSNLLFGWAHHTYFVPSALWIRHLAYIVSMSELFILGRIIWRWKSTLSFARKQIHNTAYRFLLFADIWILLNLILALLISIPAINIYTHGTHITVAHAMGTTIGINTMILLASVFFVLAKNNTENQLTPLLKFSLWLTNFALLIFWTSLILAGYIKGVLTIENRIPFAEIMLRIRPYLITFAIGGTTLMVGLVIITGIAIRRFIFYSFNLK